MNKGKIILTGIGTAAVLVAALLFIMSSVAVYADPELPVNEEGYETTTPSVIRIETEGDDDPEGIVDEINTSTGGESTVVVVIPSENGEVVPEEASDFVETAETIDTAECLPEVSAAVAVEGDILRNGQTDLVEEGESVFLSASDGSGQEIIYVNEDTILLPALMRDGFVFVCWNTEEDGSGTSYEAGSEYRITSGIDLFAVWSEGGALGEPETE